MRKFERVGDSEAQEKVGEKGAKVPHGTRLLL